MTSLFSTIVAMSKRAIANPEPVKEETEQETKEEEEQQQQQPLPPPKEPEKLPLTTAHSNFMSEKTM